MAPWGDKDREGSGGNIEYVLSIFDSKAGFTEYNDGKTCLLILDGEKEFANGRVMDDGIWVNAPAGWTPSEDGSFFVFENDDGEPDPDAGFSKNSKIQKFIKSALEAGVPLEDRGEGANDARMWKGLKLRVQEKEISFKRDGESSTYMQPLVVEFLGTLDLPGTAAPVTPTTTTSNGATKVEEQPKDIDLVGKATDIAKGCNDLIEYMDKVSKTLGVPLDHAVCSASFFESAKATASA